MTDKGKPLNWSESSSDQQPLNIDTSVPHPARVYDYWLGGKDNFAADRELAEKIIATGQDVRQSARDNRDFLGRAVRYLVSRGVTQFLDLGTGIPTAGNTHEVAQAIDPTARIAYVDNDPIVMAHARALLTSTPQGKTSYVEADIRNPDSIVKNPLVLETIDFTKPVAVMVVAILMHIKDEDDPFGATRRIMDAVPSGSYLVVTHLTTDFMTPEARAAVENAHTAMPVTPRTGDRILELFEGYDLVDPGLAKVSEWHPDEPTPADRITAMYAIAGRKP